MPNNLQQRVFDQILKLYSKRAQAIEELSALLEVGRDGIYRRLRGDTVLSPTELERLTLRYRLSLDALILEQSDTVFFSFNGFEESTKNFNEYLLGFETDLEIAAKEDDTHFYYASMELPLFQSCFFPELICFKLYVWGLTVFGYKNLQEVPFSFDLLPAPILETTRRIQQLYVNLPSSEIWGTNVVDNTLNQIEYHFGSGNFRSPDDALQLCDKLTELTYHMQKMAETGEKFIPGQSVEGSDGKSFTLFHNEMIYTSNTLLAVRPTGKILFTSLSNPHVLKSHDNRLCDYMEEWFKGVITKSNAISIQAEKQRLWFFNRLRTRIENTKQRIVVYQD